MVTRPAWRRLTLYVGALSMTVGALDMSMTHLRDEPPELGAARSLLGRIRGLQAALLFSIALPLVTRPSSCIRSLTWMLSSERTASLISLLTLASARPATSRSNFSTESSHVNGWEARPG